MKNIKTNAMRMLDQAGIHYQAIEYEVDEDNLSGGHVAGLIGLPPEQVFKTLLVSGDHQACLVFCLPVNAELDLKKAAKVSGNKKVELAAVKDLFSLTGYIRGGVSPIGMKKKFATYIDETAALFDRISVSAGVRGCQLLLDPAELIRFLEAAEADLAQ